MSLTYTDNGASETQAYRSVHMENVGSTRFERLGNLSRQAYGPPPAGVPFAWESHANASLDCSTAVTCLPPAPGHGCTGKYAGQCTWPDAQTATAACGAWKECAGFFCSTAFANGTQLCFARQTTTLTKPYGSGDAAWLKVWNRTNTMPQWRRVESGAVRTVFATDPVETLHSRVWLEVTAWAGVPRLGLAVHIDKWTNAFGVANRIVLPMAGDGGLGAVGRVGGGWGGGKEWASH